jgi:hypothetical protein
MGHLRVSAHRRDIWVIAVSMIAGRSNRKSSLAHALIAFCGTPLLTLAASVSLAGPYLMADHVPPIILQVTGGHFDVRLASKGGYNLQAQVKQGAPFSACTWVLLIYTKAMLPARQQRLSSPACPWKPGHTLNTHPAWWRAAVRDGRRGTMSQQTRRKGVAMGRTG